MISARFDVNIYQYQDEILHITIFDDLTTMTAADNCNQITVDHKQKVYRIISTLSEIVCKIQTER